MGVVHLVARQSATQLRHTTPQHNSTTQLHHTDERGEGLTVVAARAFAVCALQNDALPPTDQPWISSPSNSEAVTRTVPNTSATGAESQSSPPVTS